MQRLLILALLGAAQGCVWFSDIAEPDEPAAPIEDATPDPAPFRLTTEYDFPASEAAAATGHAALAEGRAAAAAEQYETAIEAWPANPQAWDGLAAAYRQVGDDADRAYALFFARRIAWADSSPAAGVAASFRNVAAGRVNRPVEDPRIEAMAEQLALYYAGLDVAQRMAQVGSRAEPEDLLDAVGIIPAMVASAALSIYTGARMVGVFLAD